MARSARELKEENSLESEARFGKRRAGYGTNACD